MPSRYLVVTSNATVYEICQQLHNQQREVLITLNAKEECLRLVSLEELVHSSLLAKINPKAFTIHQLLQTKQAPITALHTTPSKELLYIM